MILCLSSCLSDHLSIYLPVCRSILSWCVFVVDGCRTPERSP
jgi:hypothetical protein